MHLFARLPPLLLRRLRAALRLAIPAVVAADTARSCVVTYQLAQQRFQEWEEEDRQETRLEVAALLRGVVRRCAAQDRDFWPAFEAAAAASAASADASADAGSGTAGLTAGSSPSRSSGSAGSGLPAGESLGADVWQLLGLVGGSSGSSSSDGASSSAADEPQARQAGAGVPFSGPAGALTAEHAAWADAEAVQLSRYESRQQEAAAAAAASSARAQATLVVVTLGEAMSQVASELDRLGLPWTTLSSPPPGVVRVTMQDVFAILGATPPARAAADHGDRLGARILAAAEGAAASARASGLPWPQLALSRKSALRYAVDWRGLHRTQQPEDPLERELSFC